MTAETKKVLEMVAEGKIGPDDAEKLLEKLSAGGSATGAGKEPEKPGSTPNPRYLRILVDAPGRENVNIRVPISFLRSSMLLASVLPGRVQERLADRGIDLTGLTRLHGQELADALRELNLDVDQGNGKKVRIFCE